MDEKVKNPNLLEFVSCNLCGSRNHKPLYKINEMDIVKCPKCSLIFVNPRLNEKALLDMYEKNYFHRKVYNPNSGGFYGYVDYMADRANIVKTFENVLKFIEIYKKNGRLLDIGCAFGFFLDLAQKRGWDAHGIEPSSEARYYARDKLGLSVNQGTLGSTDLPEGYFDLITMFDVIEHLRDPSEGLAKIHRGLKQDGLLAVTTADADSLLGLILGPRFEDVRRANEHLYVFSRKTIKAMMQKCGFEVLNIKTTGKFFSLGDLSERLTLYYPALFRGLKAILKKIRLDHLTIYVNPGVKITVFARKIKKT